MKVIIQILFSLAVWGSVLFCGVRVLINGGLPIIKPQPAILRDRERIKNGIYGKIFLFAFLFRIVVYLISILMIYRLNHDISGKGFLEQWTQWDANNYLRIAKGGYTYYTENGDYLTLVFFPLYPMLISLVNVFVHNLSISALLVSSLSYAGACCFIYALVCEDYGKNTAKWTVIFLSVFPMGFFFGTMMTESVFLLTTAMTFYYIRRHQWFLAGVCGALCAFSRLIGLIMLLPAAVEWVETVRPFEKIRKKEWKIIGKDIVCVLPVLLIAGGSLLYLLINYHVTGNAFAFLQYQQKYWHHENCYFAATIADIFQYALSTGTDAVTRWNIWIPEMITFTVTAGLLVYGAKKQKTMYVLYLAAYMIINCSVTWLISGMRYMCAAVPLFIFLARLTEKHKYIRYGLAAACFILFLFYLNGYLASQQIM